MLFVSLLADSVCVAAAAAVVVVVVVAVAAAVLGVALLPLPFLCRLGSFLSPSPAFAYTHPHALPTAVLENSPVDLSDEEQGVATEIAAAIKVSAKLLFSPLSTHASSAPHLFSSPTPAQIQACFRGYLARKRYQEKRSAAIMIQRYVRRWHRRAAKAVRSRSVDEVRIVPRHRPNPLAETSQRPNPPAASQRSNPPAGTQRSSPPRSQQANPRAANQQPNSPARAANQQTNPRAANQQTNPPAGNQQANPRGANQQTNPPAGSQRANPPPSPNPPVAPAATKSTYL
jgi:hypothetical protein